MTVATQAMLPTIWLYDCNSYCSSQLALVTCSDSYTVTNESPVTVPAIPEQVATFAIVLTCYRGRVIHWEPVQSYHAQCHNDITSLR